MSVPLPPPLPPLKIDSRINAYYPNVLFQSPNSKGCFLPQNEVPKVCQRLLDNFPNSILLAWNINVLPVLQEGPSCGLAVMCMTGQLVSPTHCQLTIDNAINLAKSKGFTHNGEMFSAVNMKTLVCDAMKCQAEVLHNGLDDKLKIISHLSSGQPALVPYDADKNNEPCCKKGHKSHWAMLTGAVLVVPPHLNLCASLVPDPNNKRLYQMDDNSNSTAVNLSSLLSYDTVEVYIFARQGKSRHLEMWNYDALSLSNANLMELSPTLTQNAEQWILPEDGVNGGLRRKVILVSNN
ncbi:hypothetical protein CHUAL_012248 [Chamberlinius hualienensis]